MSEPLDPASYVPLAAAAVGLRLEPQDLDGVTGAFAVLLRVAGPLMTFALPEDLIAAAVFPPEDGNMR